MIKHLLITDIPKEEEALKKVLAVVKDHSWTTEAIEDWAEDPCFKFIWYDTKYEQYVTGRGLPSLDSVTIRSYGEVLAL